jgi:hypothetical protein
MIRIPHAQPEGIQIFLETSNGVWSIITAFVVFFLVLHLVTCSRSAQRGALGWLWGAFRMSQAMQLAAATMVVLCGVLVSRAPIWLWYAMGAPRPLPSPFLVCIAVGALVGSVGGLWMLRIITRPRGPWPVLLTLMVLIGYLAFTVVAVAGQP